MSDMLHHEPVTAPESEPEQWIYVLHGVYGAGRNWASVMRRVVGERPDWGAVLVDLRQHGRSQGMPEPHTIHAAAADVVRLVEQQGPPASALLGHSFGGKVALLGAPQLPDLRQLWVIDSTPEVRDPDGSAWTMLNLIRSLPSRFPSRAALVGALESHGVNRGVAQWMATNLEADDGAYRWRFDFAAIEALLLSFFETDAWSTVERPPAGLDVHVVRAEGSTVLAGAALERMRGATGERVHLHEVAGGHWVNAENPDAIVELLVRKLPLRRQGLPGH